MSLEKNLKSSLDIQEKSNYDRWHTGMDLDNQMLMVRFLS